MTPFLNAFRLLRSDFGKLPASIKWITLILSCYTFLWGLLDPFFPIYLKSIFGDYTETALVVAMLHLFSIALSVPIGRLADIVSKKQLITFVLFLYLPLGPLLALLKTFTHFALFRLYHAVLATGLWATSETYIRSHSPPHQRSESLGLLDSGLNLAVVLGAVLSGFIVAAFGIPTIFFIIPAVILVALALAIVYLPDHSGTTHWSRGLVAFRPSVFWESIVDFWSHRPLVFLAGLSLLFGLGATGVSAVLLPLFSEALGATPVQIGIIFALSLAPFLFSGPLAVVADHVSNRVIVFVAGTAATVLLGALSMTESIRWLFILASLLGLCFAALGPIIGGHATGFMPRSHIGELNGVYRAVGHVSASIGILVIGPLADRFGIQAPFLFSTGAMALFTLAAVWGWGRMDGRA